MFQETLPQTPFKFIIFFLKPYLWLFLSLILIAFLWAVNASFEPYLIKLMIDILEKTPPSTMNLFYHLRVPVLIYVLARVFINIIDRIYDYISLKVMPQFNKNIVIRLTEYIQQHSHSYFQNHFGGSIVSKISTTADTAEKILEVLIYDFMYPFFALCVAAWTMSTVNTFLALIFLTWIVVFIGVSYYLSIYVHKLSQELSEKSTTLIGKLIDSITNILAVRLFARRKYEIRFLESSAQEKVTKGQELRWYHLKREAVLGIMVSGLILILTYFLILQRQRGEVSIGDFTLVLTLSLSIVDIIWNISRKYIHFVEDMGKCSQALITIMAPHEIKDDLDATPLVIKAGSIEFKKLTFSYIKSSPFFKGLSVKLQGGEKVGIVGHSGSGKTTFANLIVRLFDAESGAVLIDGQDIRKVTQDSLHQNISFIPQDPLLFHRTILENIRYGRLDASEEEVRDAAEKANADEFIRVLPQGYHTVVGERGAKISGGQRQRLAIARAILKNAKILILDEATSALDSVTEHYIQQSLDCLMQGKTVLVIAHRLSTLLKMDRLIVFSEGKIVEEGTHKTLLKKEGVYAKFWNMQAY